MAEFLGDLTVYAGVALAVWGLLLLHRAGAPDSSVWLRTAGWLALVVGIGGAVCTATYMFKYRAQGDFDHAYPPMMMKAMDGGGMMMGGGKGGMGMMGGGMMGRGMKGEGMPSEKPAGPETAKPSAPPADEQDHKAHHPDTAP